LTAGLNSSQNLENCIRERELATADVKHENVSSKQTKRNVVKLIRANGGYLGTQRR